MLTRSELKITPAVTGSLYSRVPAQSRIRDGFEWDDFQGLDAPYALACGSAYRYTYCCPVDGPVVVETSVVYPDSRVH